MELTDMYTSCIEITEHAVDKYLEEAFNLAIKAEGAEQAYIEIAKKFVRQEMGKKGIRRGMKIKVEGEVLFVEKEGHEWETMLPVLNCVPLTKKGTPSKTSTTTVYISGIRNATVIKEDKKP